MDFEQAVTLVANLGWILGATFYLSLVLWTYKDARRRIDDPILVATSVAASIALPLIGVVVYIMLRPPEYLDDVRERELEIRAMERTLGARERCPKCRAHVEAEFVACPICATRLRDQCVTCSRTLDRSWALCPYCETEVPKTKPFDVERASAQAATPPKPKVRTAPAPPPRKRVDVDRPASMTSPRTAAERNGSPSEGLAAAAARATADIVSEPMEPPTRSGDAPAKAEKPVAAKAAAKKKSTKTASARKKASEATAEMASASTPKKRTPK